MADLVAQDFVNHMRFSGALTSIPESNSVRKPIKLKAPGGSPKSDCYFSSKKDKKQLKKQFGNKGRSQSKKGTNCNLIKTSKK